MQTRLNMPKIQDITVEEEYEKNPELNRDDLKALQEWVSKQAHLPQISGNRQSGKKRQS